MRVDVIWSDSIADVGGSFSEALRRVLLLAEFPDRMVESEATFSLSFDGTTRYPVGGRYSLKLKFGNRPHADPEVELWLFKDSDGWKAVQVPDPGEFADTIVGLDRFGSVEQLFPRTIQWMLIQCAPDHGYTVEPLPERVNEREIEGSLYDLGPYCPQFVCQGSDLDAK